MRAMRTSAPVAKRLSRPVAKRGRKAKLILFAALAAAWLILDQVTKALVASEGVGSRIYESQLGLFDIILVHNTGGAWGMLAGQTWVLGIFSLIVCGLILIYVLTSAGTSSTLGIVALSLVFAGGLGNAIDRFCHGYVIDFLSTAFMDFPVFNVADIGVTVGVALFLVSLLMGSRRRDHGTADQL